MLVSQAFSTPARVRLVGVNVDPSSVLIDRGCVPSRMASAAKYHTVSPDVYVFGAPTVSINSVYRLGMQLGQAGSFGVCRLATRLTDGTSHA